MTAYRADRHVELKRFEQHMALAAGQLDGCETRVRNHHLHEHLIEQSDHRRYFSDAILELDTARHIAASLGANVEAFDRERAVLGDAYAIMVRRVPLTFEVRLHARRAYELLRTVVPGTAVPSPEMPVQHVVFGPRRLELGRAVGPAGMLLFVAVAAAMVLSCIGLSVLYP